MAGYLFRMVPFRSRRARHVRQLWFAVGDESVADAQLRRRVGTTLGPLDDDEFAAVLRDALCEGVLYRDCRERLAAAPFDPGRPSPFADL